MAELRSRLRPRLRGSGRWIVFAVLTFGAASPARADAPSSEAAAEARRSEAKTKFEEGVDLYGEHKYRDAVNAFLQADAIAPSAALSFNIARAFEHLDDPTAALRWYRDYLRRSPRAQNVAEVQARVTALSATLAERGVQQLSVLSTPSGAAVSIDNQPRGTTPLTLELAPGAHHVSLRLAGYTDKDADFSLDARTPQDYSLELTPSTPVSVSAPVATTASSAKNPRERGSAKASRPFGPAPFVVLGAGGVSLLGALGFELSRRSAESAAETAPQREYLQHFDAMQSRQTTARVLAGVGGALLLTGGVLLVLNTPKEPAAELAVGCGDAGCSLWAGGRFQ